MHSILYLRVDLIRILFKLFCVFLEIIVISGKTLYDLVYLALQFLE
jgi:hypothetical protein